MYDQLLGDVLSNSMKSQHGHSKTSIKRTC